MSTDQEREREQEVKNVTIIVRALITSAKPPVSLQSIECDYYNVEHQRIPYQRLGYRSVVEMLDDTNAFYMHKYGNEIIIAAKPNPKTAHIASMVRSQKPSKTKSFARPQAAPVRPSVRPVANYSNANYNANYNNNASYNAAANYNNNTAAKPAGGYTPYNNNYAQQQAEQVSVHVLKQLQQKIQQEAQQAQQAVLNEELCRFRRELDHEIEHLRKQQKEQQDHERELQRRQFELREEQEQQKKQLQQQQLKINKQITQLQEQHNESLKAQALTIEQLQEERVELQLKLKFQEATQAKLKQEEQTTKPNLQQQLQQREKAAGKREQQLQAQHQHDLKTHAQTIQNLQEELSELQQREQEAPQRKPKQEEQKLQQPESRQKDTDDPLNELKISSEVEVTEMNGNAASPGSGSGGGATGRKPHLRAILGNSAPVPPAGRPQQWPLADVAGIKRQPNARVVYPGARSGTTVSVNYRLKQQQTTEMTTTTTTSSPPAAGALGSAGLPITPPDSPENGTSQKTTPTPAQRHQHQQPKFNMHQPMLPKIQPVRPSVNFKFDPAYDAISLLKRYCVALGFAPPEYEYYNANKSKEMHCKVRIGETIFTSYPEEHPNETTAKQRTSEVAVQRLKFLESRKQLSMLNDDEFLDGLYKELVKHPHGIVSHKLPEWYEATVKRQVPNNWESLINTSPKMRVESSVNTNIVFANTETGAGSASQQQLQQQQKDVDIAAMPELQLPWLDGQQDWSMYITHCDTTMHVWARLIDQSANFEKLTEQLNAYMSEPQNRQPVQQPDEQQIYLVEVSENWNRMRVMSLDAEQRQCSCHFVDYGDEAIFGYDTLYLCPPQFLALPAQAVCLSMYALDKFEEHPHALPVLAKELAAHSVVARIITSETQFHNAGGRTQGVLLPQDQEQNEENCCAHSVTRRACIVGTFYDTSTSEDIHLNDLVANQIIRATPAPMLKLDQKPNHALVSHVNDVGDLMVQLPNEDLKFVQRSIARIMSDSSEQHRVRYADLLHDKLVCVCDESGDGVKQWYRGMLTAKPKTPEEEVFDVYYVDDGRLRKTHITNIYRLEDKNLALASYPAQALRVRLHDVPPIDNQMVGRLRSLLSPQTPVLIKVMEGANDKLPMVTIHARGQNSLYLCLNSAIRMEYEVQSF